MKIISHFLILTSAFILVFIWEISPLSNYTIQALGVLVAFYLLSSIIRKKRNPNSELFSQASDIFILTISILLVISITGNLYSPLFFLLYFLGFGITFIFEPVAVFVFALGSVLIFLPEALKNGSVESFLRLGSIVLISPLAFFFGQEYKDRDAQEEEIVQMQERAQDAANTISQDVEDVLEKEKDSLKPEEVQELNDILEETEDLRQENTNK